MKKEDDERCSFSKARTLSDSATLPAAVSALMLRLPPPTSLDPTGAMMGTREHDRSSLSSCVLTMVGSPTSPKSSCTSFPVASSTPVFCIFFA